MADFLDCLVGGGLAAAPKEWRGEGALNSMSLSAAGVVLNNSHKFLSFSISLQSIRRVLFPGRERFKLYSKADLE